MLIDYLNLPLAQWLNQTYHFQQHLEKYKALRMELIRKGYDLGELGKVSILHEFVISLHF